MLSSQTRFFHRYQPGFHAPSMQTVSTPDDSNHPSYEIVHRMIKDFHTKQTQLERIQHMTQLFRELLHDPYLVQTNWKFNCSIKTKITNLRGDVNNFMDDKKRYRQLYSILGAMSDKTDHDAVKNALRDSLIRRVPFDQAFRELAGVMNQLETIVDEFEKSAFTLKLLNDQQIYIIPE